MSDARHTKLEASGLGELWRNEETGELRWLAARAVLLLGAPGAWHAPVAVKTPIMYELEEKHR